MSSRSKNEDRLSHLPDEVLGHILSLMPTKFAVRTSTLSKKWRDIWTLVTNLDFLDYLPFHGRDCFSNFVDRVLKVCKTSQVKLFRLHIVCFWVEKSDVLKWINEAVGLNVCELDIEVNVIPAELPLILFNCKTLTKLRLSMVTGLNFVNVPSPVTFPALKTLDINVGGECSVIIMRLIHGCPVLESLSLEIMASHRDEQDCNVNIPTLKRLEIKTWNRVYKPKVVLNVPNLKYLVVSGKSCPHFVMEDLPSSVKVTVFLSMMASSYPLVSELLKGLSGVKSLSWSLSLDYGHIAYFPRPKIPNLKHLEAKGSYGWNWKSVIQILESCSGLEHLCFEELEGSCWIEPRSVPTCILSNLKTMKITRCKGRECDIQFLKYLLGNAEVLKRLTIICENLSMKEEKELRARLLRFPRASRFCEIHMDYGKWLKSAGN